MPGPIAEAFVEVRPDVSDFPAELGRDIDQALDRVQAQVDQSVGEIAQSFDELARRADTSLRSIGTTANVTGEQIERAFAEASIGASEDLGDIGGTDAFGPVLASAAEASAVVAETFSVASNRADSELREIGGADAFAPVVASAAAAGAAIDASIGGATRDAAGRFVGLGAAGAAASGRIGSSANSLAIPALIGTGTVVATAIAAFDALGVHAAGNLEQVRLAFEPLVPDVDAFIGKVEDFAARTPFTFDQVITGAQRLIGALGQTGDQAIETLTDVGNAAAAAGVSGEAIQGVITPLAQINSLGKLTQDNLNQISNQIPSFNQGAVFENLAASMGITAEEAHNLAQNGQILAEDAIPAILQALRETPGALGAMERQSRTLNGALSSLSDIAQQTLAASFGEFANVIRDEVLGSLENLDQIIRPFSDAFARLGSEVFPPILDLMLTLSPAIGQVVDALSPLIGGLLSGLVAAATPLIQAFGRTFEIFAPVLATFGDALERVGVLLGDTFAEILPQMEPLLEAFADSMEDLAEPLTELVVVLLEALLPLLPQIVRAFTPFIRAFTALGDAGVEVLAFIIDLVAEIVRFTIPAFEALGSAVGVVGDALNEFIDWIRDVIDWLGDRLEPAVRIIIDIIDEFTSKVEGLLDFASDLPIVGDLFNGIADDVEHFADEGARALEIFDDKGTSGWLDWADRAHEILDGVTAEVQAQADEMQLALGHIFEDFATPEKVDEPLRGLAESVGGLVLDLSSMALSESQFEDLASKFGVSAEELEEIFDDVGSAVEGFLGDVAEEMPGVTTAFDAARSSAEELGRELTAGDIITGLEDTLEEISKFHFNVARLAEAGFEGAAQIAAEQGPEVAAALAQALEDGNTEQLAGIEQLAFNIGVATDDTLRFMNSEFGPEIAGAAALAAGLMDDAFARELDFMKGVDAAAIKAKSALQKAATDDSFGVKSAGKTIGDKFTEGMKEGIDAGMAKVLFSATVLANKTKQVTEDSFGIKSPSRVFMTIGEQIGAGMALGIDRSLSTITTAVSSTATAVTSPFTSATPTISPEFTSVSAGNTRSVVFEEGAIQNDFTGLGPAEADTMFTEKLGWKLTTRLDG